MWARIIKSDGVQIVAEIVEYDPSILPPEVASEFVPFEDGMVYRAELLDGVWVPPPEPDPLPAPEPEPDPQPVPLDYVRYVALVKQAGGLSAATATQIVDGTHSSAEVNFVQRLMERHSGNFVLSDPLVQQGLDTLVTENVLTQAGKDAISAAWPTG